MISSCSRLFNQARKSKKLNFYLKKKKTKEKSNKNTGKAGWKRLGVLSAISIDSCVSHDAA